MTETKTPFPERMHKQAVERHTRRAKAALEALASEAAGWQRRLESGGAVDGDDATNLAALAALVTPWLMGRLLDDLTAGTTYATINRIALAFLAAVLIQTVLVWFARRAAFVMGEEVFAGLRERYVERVVELPLSTVERAGTASRIFWISAAAAKSRAVLILSMRSSWPASPAKNRSGRSSTKTPTPPPTRSPRPARASRCRAPAAPARSA